MHFGSQNEWVWEINLLKIKFGFDRDHVFSKKIVVQLSKIGVFEGLVSLD